MNGLDKMEKLKKLKKFQKSIFFIMLYFNEKKIRHLFNNIKNIKNC